MSEFPELPPPPPGLHSWPPQVLRGYERLASIYERAATAAEQSRDSARLLVHEDAIEMQACALLEAFSRGPPGAVPDREWILECLRVLSEVAGDIQIRREDAESDPEDE